MLTVNLLGVILCANSAIRGGAVAWTTCTLYASSAFLVGLSLSQKQMKAMEVMKTLGREKKVREFGQISLHALFV